MHDRSGDADRPRLLRPNEIKIGVSRSRVLQTRYPLKTRRIPIAGKYQTGQEESWRGRRRVKAIQPIRESRLPFLAPSQRVFRGGRKLNNSLSRRFSGTSRRCHRRNRKTTGRYIYSDDKGSQRYLTEFDRLVCGTSIYLKISVAKFVINPNHSQSV